MSKSKTRERKYDPLIQMLNDGELYTPAKIADFADSVAFFIGEDAEDHRLKRLRIRIAMGQYSTYHGFPRKGDGLVSRSGQPLTPGWFGWRWKKPPK